MYKFKLYITGQNSHSARVIDILTVMLKERFGDNFSLKIINLTAFPESAREDKILVTPTLIRTQPKPTKRVVGTLANRENILIALKLLEKE